MFEFLKQLFGGGRKQESKPELTVGRPVLGGETQPVRRLDAGSTGISGFNRLSDGSLVPISPKDKQAIGDAPGATYSGGYKFPSGAKLPAENKYTERSGILVPEKSDKPAEKSTQEVVVTQSGKTVSVPRPTPRQRDYSGFQSDLNQPKDNVRDYVPSRSRREEVIEPVIMPTVQPVFVPSVWTEPVRPVDADRREEGGGTLDYAKQADADRDATGWRATEDYVATLPQETSYGSTSTTSTYESTYDAPVHTNHTSSSDTFSGVTDSYNTGSNSSDSGSSYSSSSDTSSSYSSDTSSSSSYDTSSSSSSYDSGSSFDSGSSSSGGDW